MKSNNKTILLVEDDMFIAAIEKENLEDIGYRVIHAASGEEAVKIALDNKIIIDLILMDIDLGSGMDGTQAASEILKHRDVPIVFLSSYTESEIVEKTEKITSYGYVVKNSGITVLDASIKMAFMLFDAKEELKTELEQRKIIEEVLRTNEQCLRAILENTHDIFVLMDLEGRFLHYIGPDFYGVKPEETYGKTAGDFIGEEEHKKVIQAVQRVLASGEKDVYENSVVWNGEKIWFMDETCPVFDQNGQITAVSRISRNITGLKKIESERFEREAFLRETQALASLGGWKANPETDYLEWSTGVYDIVEEHPDFRPGFNEGEKYFNPEYMPAVNEGILNCLSTGEPFTTEAELITAKGQKRWVEVRAFARSDENGQPLVMGTIQDITERRKTETQLRESLEYNRTLFIESPVALGLVSMEGAILDINPALSEILGYTLEEFKQLTYWQLTPEEYEPQEQMQLKKLKERGCYGPYEKEYFHKDGHRVPVRLQGRILHKDGESYIWSSMEDITERKNAEEALRLKNLVFDLSIAANSIADKYGNLTEVNDTFLRTWGYSSRKEVVGRPIAHFLEYQEDTEMIIAELDRSGKWEGDYTAKKKDGSHFTAHGLATVILDETGNLIGYQSAVEDITERKNAEEAVRQQLKEKEILLKEVHHRIKNNIVSIGSMLSLHARSVSNKEAKRIIIEAVARINSMSNVYDKLLLTGDYRKLSVKKYLEDLIRSILLIYPETQSSIYTEITIDEFRLDVRKLVALGIIVNELITNAIKHAFTEREKGVIGISLKKQHGKIILSVSDDGKGLPEGFDMEQSGHFGFTILKMFTQNLGAELCIEKGKGTKVIIRFS